MITDTSDKTYLTYWIETRDQFDKSKISIDLKYQYNGKPTTAFWGSPEDAEYGWKEWCEAEDYDTGEGGYNWNNPIKWKLEKGSKILQIGPEEVELVPENQLLEYVNIVRGYIDRTIYKDLTIEEKIKLIENGGDTIEIDYKRMKENGIVAVELLDSCIGHLFINRLEICFNGWDCESICVLDTSKIVWL